MVKSVAIKSAHRFFGAGNLRLDQRGNHFLGF
jgi:hypothetical protein